MNFVEFKKKLELVLKENNNEFTFARIDYNDFSEVINIKAVSDDLLKFSYELFSYEGFFNQKTVELISFKRLFSKYNNEDFEFLYDILETEYNKYIKAS